MCYTAASHQGGNQDVLENSVIPPTLFCIFTLSFIYMRRISKMFMSCSSHVIGLILSLMSHRSSVYKARLWRCLNKRRVETNDAVFFLAPPDRSDM